MKFKVPVIDLRSQQMGADSIEDENGNVVGHFWYRHGSGDRNRDVNLFGKYKGSFGTWSEAQAFADGVAAVLSHLTRVDLE